MEDYVQCFSLEIARDKIEIRLDIAQNVEFEDREGEIA